MHVGIYLGIQAENVVSSYLSCVEVKILNSVCNIHLMRLGGISKADSVI